MVGIKVFLYNFCMMIEGSGSGRPKNMWIRWIRIRIRNTGFNFYLCSAAPVLQLKAVDQDNSSTPAGQIVFSIVSTHNKFTIDPKTGWLATNKVNDG